MTKTTYDLLESYMLSCMKDSAHDKEHIYRVLYNALSIAETEKDVNYDVLIPACLLHDIGRKEQFADPVLDHAEIGAKKAYDFLLKNHFSEEITEKICHCIRTHRYRNNDEPESIEAKILFDADNIDAAGAVGIARTLIYKGEVSEPLYSLLPNGMVSDGKDDLSPSFFREYKYKLENLYSHFYTKKGALIARERQQSAVTFYNNLFHEVSTAYKSGKGTLMKHLEN